MIGVAEIVVSQIECVLLRNLLYLVATGSSFAFGSIFAFADNGGGAPLGANRRVTDE